jgi:adenosine deaminase
VSISPDDPGFFDAEGVTLDFVYAFLAWELDLADLKQLCINSLNYALISDDEKEQIRPFFEERWTRFLEYVRGKF